MDCSGVEIHASRRENTILTVSGVSCTRQMTRIPAETQVVQTFLKGVPLVEQVAHVLWPGLHAVIVLMAIALLL